MPEVSCDDCGKQVTVEPARQAGPGPPPLTIDVDCPCGARWTTLADGTKWRRPTVRRD